MKNEQNKQNKQNNGLLRMIAPALITIIACIICLFSATWAWFSATTSANVNEIRSAQFKAVFLVTENGTQIQPVNGSYVLKEGNAYVVKITSTGTEGAKGYVMAAFDGKTYCTDTLTAPGAYSFTINAEKDGSLALSSSWGKADLQGSVISDGEILGKAPQNNTIMQPEKTEEPTDTDVLPTDKPDNPEPSSNTVDEASQDNGEAQKTEEDTEN